MKTKNFIKKISIVFILFSLCYCDNYSQTEFEFRDIITGLDTPWEILWGKDNHIWLTERFGRISRLNPQTSEIQHLITINDVFMKDENGDPGERGLMGLELHPNFIDSPYVYTIYTYGNRNNTKIKVVRYIFDGKTLHSPIILLDNIKGAWNHNGARLLIDTSDMTMYISMGDAAETALSQNLNSLNGKILRMNLDGTIPKNNPFANSYVYSWGLRNPQGLVFANGKLYSSEHGPSTDDELNIIYKGRNYGWPNVNGYCDKPQEMQFCKDSNVVEPILSMTPQRTYAVCGIDYYNHNLIPEFKNSILIACLKDSKLVLAKLNENGDAVIEEKIYFEKQFGRLRDLCISPDGRIFIATSNRDGRGNPKQIDDRIIEIKPKTSSNSNKNEQGNIFNIKSNPAINSAHFVINNNSTNTNIKILDINGNNKRNLLLFGKNHNELIWDGFDNEGFQVAPGLYFAVINANGENYTIKFLLIR